MKLKLDRDRHEMSKHGIIYRVGKRYQLNTEECAGQVSLLNNIGYHGPSKTYFLNFENGVSINLDYAYLYIGEIDSVDLACGKCGHRPDTFGD
jgi:hypothetical protein